MRKTALKCFYRQNRQKRIYEFCLFREKQKKKTKKGDFYVRKEIKERKFF